jgi:D-alanyl-D-alanine carboxypeptidase/D-alanyl-D-alanine-endopeptidase (penicillin-binding protein 4)
MGRKIAFVVVLLGVMGLAKSPEGLDSSSLEKLLSGIKVSQSVLITRLSDGKVLWEKDADQLVSPASVTKVITSAAALAKFSPVHTFKTPLYYTGSRQNDRIAGDLVIVGDGDPFLISEKLWQLAADLKNMGIKEFAGDLVIDSSLFDEEVRDESRMDSARLSHNAYNAPISAFGVNFNTLAVTVAPNTGVGRPALVSIDPYPLRDLVIENNIQTAKAGVVRQIDIKRRTKRGQDKLVASGTIAVDAPLQKVYRSVGDPLSASGEYVKAFLKNEGVIVRGKVRAGRKPEGSTFLMELESYEMRRIVAGLNTFSNNYIADVLLKRLGAAFPRQGEADAPGQGTFANGLAVLTDFLRKDVGIKTDFVLKNGSGLDTENRLSARQVVGILAFMESRMDLFPEFLASLPAAGWDGTLKKRLKKTGDTEALQGLFRAKTGTLTEPVTVASLAGYFRHPKHGLVAFCVLENGQEGLAQPSLKELRERQDRLMAVLLGEG